MNLKLLITGIGFIIISLLHLIMRDNYLEFKRNHSGAYFNEVQTRNVIAILIIGFFIFGIIFICVSFFYR